MSRRRAGLAFSLHRLGRFGPILLQPSRLFQALLVLALPNQWPADVPGVHPPLPGKGKEEEVPLPWHSPTLPAQPHAQALALDGAFTDAFPKAKEAIVSPPPVLEPGEGGDAAARRPRHHASSLPSPCMYGVRTGTKRGGAAGCLACRLQGEDSRRRFGGRGDGREAWTHA